MMARPFQNLLLQAYLSYKGLFLWLNWTAYVSNVIVAPPILAVLIAFSSRFANAPEGPDRYIQGMVIYSITLVILGGVVQCFYYDRAFGTLSFVYISPGNRWLTYLSRGLFHLPNGMLVAVSGLLCAWALLDSDFSKVSWLTALHQKGRLNQKCQG